MSIQFSEPNGNNVNTMSGHGIYSCCWIQWRYSTHDTAHTFMSLSLALFRILNTYLKLLLDNSKAPRFIQSRPLTGLSAQTPSQKMCHHILMNHPCRCSAGQLVSETTSQILPTPHSLTDLWGHRSSGGGRWNSFSSQFCGAVFIYSDSKSTILPELHEEQHQELSWA